MPKSTNLPGRMNPPPRFASSTVREKIVAALKNRGRRFIGQDDHTSRNYLDKWRITADGLFAELATDLGTHQLYLKPNTTPQRYQYVLPHPGGETTGALLIHITLTPKGDPPRVKVSLHPHNTGHAPLKRVPLA